MISRCSLCEIVVHIFEHIVNLVKSVFLVKKKFLIFATKLKWRITCMERIILVVKIDENLGGYQNFFYFFYLWIFLKWTFWIFSKYYLLVGGPPGRSNKSNEIAKNDLTLFHKTIFSKNPFFPKPFQPKTRKYVPSQFTKFC